MCNQRSGGSGEQRLPPLKFTKSPEALRKCSSRTQRVQTSGNSQGKVSGVAQGPCTIPDLRASSLALLHPSAPRTPPSFRGEPWGGWHPPPSQGWGRAREEIVGYSVRFPPAVPPGLTVRSPSCFVWYFFPEELILEPKSHLFPRDILLSSWTRVFLNTLPKTNCTSLLLVFP